MLVVSDNIYSSLPPPPPLPAPSMWNFPTASCFVSASAAKEANTRHFFGKETKENIYKKKTIRLQTHTRLKYRKKYSLVYSLPSQMCICNHHFYSVHVGITTTYYTMFIYASLIHYVTVLCSVVCGEANGGGSEGTGG